MWKTTTNMFKRPVKESCCVSDSAENGGDSTYANESASVAEGGISTDTGHLRSAKSHFSSMEETNYGVIFWGYQL